jgi:hypothetical protein
MARSWTACGLALIVALLPACVRAGWETSHRDGAPRDAPPTEQLSPFDGGASCEMSTANLPASCTCEAVDFNGDGLVDVRDLSILSGCFGEPPVGACAIADTDKDGRVDCRDLACLAKHYLSGGCSRRDSRAPG